MKQHLIQKKRELRSLRLMVCDHDPHAGDSTCPGASIDRALNCLDKGIRRLAEDGDAA